MQSVPLTVRTQQNQISPLGHPTGQQQMRTLSLPHVPHNIMVGQSNFNQVFPSPHLQLPGMAQNNYTYQPSGVTNQVIFNERGPLTPPHIPTHSYAGPQPRIVPPPVYNLPQPQSLLTPEMVKVDDTISPILPPLHNTEDRRHSVSIAVLQQPENQNNTPVPTSHSQTQLVTFSDGEHSMSGKSGIKIKKETVDAPFGKAIYNTGEKYNTAGQLIGKSGKLVRDTKRAAQNRSAQKAFRLRREKYIKNLEQKSKIFDDIVRENQQLKEQLNSLTSRLQQ
ncbi:Cin5p KNAG_0B03190 [Huiozyma naganishii CBS 8797]|uniref:BZIP domain-containing protein n=1 Tax=Huiozyma naganishii (strain ATCC MYA-139 / BCRC 22969 / CBS 8797 / KCTC 17520 / NBRC 10181 / NCYC 3082 / Yp74L-3) TaxID=1071383 RepID=J7R1R7_HUIN7|nr:hypothetical protein KNAG_0B03190 [Kazachstania naganishii CBS 8797]CCK68760.1 hypothetical protein KNAG_0B03190 [Kazachstania naganishii CBS 8797]